MAYIINPWNADIMYTEAPSLPLCKNYIIKVGFLYGYIRLSSSSNAMSSTWSRVLYVEATSSVGGPTAIHTYGHRQNKFCRCAKYAISLEAYSFP